MSFINQTHVKVLLKKDFFTLWRNKTYIFAFLIVPIGMMSIFFAIQHLIDKGNAEGSLINDNFRYVSSGQQYPFPIQGLQANPIPSFYDYDPVRDCPIKEFSEQKCQPNENSTLSISTLLINYIAAMKLKSKANRFAIINSDETISHRAKTFFQNVIFQTQNTNLSVDIFDNESVLLEIIQNQAHHPYFGAILIDKFNTTTNEFVFKVSFPKEQTPDTNLDAFNSLVSQPDLTSYDQWFYLGYNQLFPAVSEFIARYKKYDKDLIKDETMFSNQNPLYQQMIGFSPMKSDKFSIADTKGIKQLSLQFPNFFLFIYIIPVFYVTTKLAEEKESKAREGMKMMGLKDGSYYLSWILFNTVVVFFISFIVTIIQNILIFKMCNFSVLICFNFLYGLSFFGSTWLCIAVFPNKRDAALAVVLINYLSFFVSAVIREPSTPSIMQYLFSIFPNVCMFQMVKQIFFFNYQTRDGLSFASAGTSYQGFSFGNGLYILLFQTIIYTFFGLYLDQVIPSQFGVAKPWYFLCICQKRRRVQEFDQNRIDSPQLDKKNFEQVSDSLKRQEQTNECLKIRSLVKRFGEKTVVKGTDLTFYNGQIFALLGHNGAGKTTTFSMLTGLIQPTSGKASVFGLDIFNEMEDFRKVLGVCPQHDVLFDFLTAEDHLRLFASFKGTQESDIEQQIQQMLIDIDLDKQKNQLAKNLSGGQKRKLSVAISMIGNSKVIMLDEPTSGMDALSRRKLWDMLKKNKAGKIIILTTHYMDEADILGDRIAIMAEGKVQCTGSSFFLKNRYGVGYNLVIAKKDRKPAPQVDKFVLGKVFSSKKLQEVSSEIAYQLPTESQSQFKQFFAEFDANQDQLGIRSYSVGITTLEEVFLKIGHGEEEEIDQKSQKFISITDKNLIIEGQEDIENYSIAQQSEPSFFSQLYQLIRKKMLMQFRNKKALAVDIFFPNIIIIAGLWLSTIQLYQNGVTRNLSPDHLYESSPIYYNTNSSNLQSDEVSDFVQKYIVKTNSSFFELNDNSTVPIEVQGKNMTQLASVIDNYAFDQAKKTGKRASAAFYFQDLKPGTESPLSLNRFYSAVVFVNSTAQEIAGSYASFLSTAFLKKYLHDSGVDINDDLKVTYIDQPFPLTVQIKAFSRAAAGSITGLMITVAFLMISDSQMQSIIKERQKNIKHQIMVSGSSLTAYWLSHYISDMIFQSITCLVAMIGMWIFNLDLPQVWILFIVNLFANPVFVYAVSFFFERDEAGSLAIKGIYFIFGTIVPVAISILQVLDQQTQAIADQLKWFFYPMPMYSFSSGYWAISNKDILSIVIETNQSYSSFNPKIAGYSLIFLILAIPFYWSIVICFELKIFDRIPINQKTQKNTNDLIFSSFKKQTPKVQNLSFESEIEEEFERIQKSDQNLPARVNQVSKTFGNIKALNNLSFGLEFGECFALLGVSGAGKSTLFKCLTGEIYPDAGSLTIQGFDVSTTNGFAQARKQIGYCPQFDCIFEGLTVKEHIEIYSTLKGIKSNIRERLIEKVIEEMDLKEFENVAVNNLSGGNKRKVSVAIAIIGNPPLVFLDEPSTGVDPQAKRFMWNILSKISTLRKKCAVIITTHSMEEAEALCTKMGIMVAGEFKCFGSSTHIKDKYGTGYELEVKIRTLTEQQVQQIIQKNEKLLPFTLQTFSKFLKANDAQDLIEEVSPTGIGNEIFEQLLNGSQIDPAELIQWSFTELNGKNLINHIKQKFKKFKIIEHYGSSWKLKVSRDSYSIGYLFGMMEDNKLNFNISEYSVTQTTLEAIFNNLTKQEDMRSTVDKYNKED